MKNAKVFWLVVVLLVGLDQLTKHLAVTYLKPVKTVTALPGLLNLTFVENRGAAFGILQGGQWLFVLFTVVVTVGVAIILRRLPQTRVYTWVRLGLAMLVGGAWGNGLDRMFRGYVVDFFDAAFIDFPVFNVADICVVGGVLLLMVLILFFIKEEKQP